MRCKGSYAARIPLLRRGGESRGVASAGVVLVKQKQFLPQHDHGVSRHPSAAEERSLAFSSVNRLLLFILLLLSFPYTASPQTRESSSVVAAIEELNRGNIFEAIHKLKLTLQQNTAPQAYLYLSGIYTRMGRYDTAYRYLSRSMDDNPVQAAHYEQLGLIRRYEGCRLEAMAAFRQALMLATNREEATLWRHVGEVHVDLFEWDKAIEAFRNTLRVRPNDATAHLALGRIYTDRNDPERALVELRAALEISPAIAGLHAALGRAYRAAGNPEAAIDILTKGIERDSSDQESRYLLGQTLLAAGRTREGRQALHDYQQLQERIEQTNTLFEAAVGRAQAGDLAEAEKAIREALGRAPRYAPALQILGTVLLNRGNVQQAVETFRQSLTGNPLNSETYLNLGAAHLRLGNLNVAFEMTEKALVIEDQDARHYAQLGDIYARMGMPDQSRTALEKAASLKSAPGYRPPDPYGSEGRRRDDVATVREICGGPPLP